jgi:hypothetical protein
MEGLTALRSALFLCTAFQLRDLVHQGSRAIRSSGQQSLNINFQINGYTSTSDAPIIYLDNVSLYIW